MTLVKDPVEVGDSYILNYLSKGKRGNNHFVCRITIQNQKLFVLTAQVKEDDYSSKEDEPMCSVESFTVL